MQLIDKDKLLKYLADLQLSCKKNNLDFNIIEKIIMDVEILPAVESSGWISVKERPPKPGRPVFGLGADGTIKAVRGIGYGIFLNSINSRVEQITHWMQPHNPPEVKK